MDCKITIKTRDDHPTALYVNNHFTADLDESFDGMSAEDILDALGIEITDKYIITPMPRDDHRFAFDQSTTMNSITGLIGTFTGCFENDGTLSSRWKPFDRELDCDAFHAAAATVLGVLRVDGAVLCSMDDLADFCECFPETRFDSASDYYGIRVDTDDYIFMVRLIPDKGTQNVCAYAYQRSILERYVEHSKNGIRFISSNYDNKFRIADGDSILIKRADDTSVKKQCRYIDGYHVEIGGNPYHICEFAEIMERQGDTVIPLRSSLPEMCYSILPSTGDIIMLVKGSDGYIPTNMQAPEGEGACAMVNELNQELGVTKSQEMAMSVGSMFGWEVKGADPANYDESGKLNPHRSRSGDAR